MKVRDHDFVRNPVVQTQVFFLESKCAFCGVSILPRSIEEVVALEQLHRAACTPSNSCCITGLA
jgi:hypothetical protein